MSDIDRLSLDFAARHPDSFARILGRGDFEDCERVIDSLPAERKAAIVARLPAARISQVLASERQNPGDWLVEAPFDEAVTLLSRIPRDKRLALVNGLQDRERQRQLLRNQQYPAHSVGALAGDIALRVVAATPASEVLAEIRDLDLDAQGPIVVVDAAGHYLGALDRWRLALRAPAAGIAEDYLVPLKAVRPETSVTAIVMKDEWNTRNWLPVIDHRRRVLGAVSREKVFRAADALSGSEPGGGDILLGLLADLVHFCDEVLERAFLRKDTT